MTAPPATPHFHAVHVAEHLQFASQLHEADRVEQVLRRACLEWHGTHIKRADGSELTPDDCRAYLVAVRALLGSASHLLAKAKFILVDCAGAE